MTTYADSEAVFTKIAEVRDVTVDQLRDRLNTDPLVVRSRQIAAIVLGEHWGNSRDGRIAMKLNASMKFVDIAIRLSHEDSAFQADLAAFGASAAAGPTETKDEEKTTSTQAPRTLSNEQILRAIAKQNFGYDEWATIFKKTHGTKVARARRTLMLIGRDYLSMTRHEIVDLLDSNLAAVDKAVGVMSEDVDQNSEVRRRICNICKEHGIEFVRRRVND